MITALVMCFAPVKTDMYAFADEYEDEEVLPFEIDGRWVNGILYGLLEDGTVRVDGIDTDAIGSTSVTIPGNVTIEGKNYTVSTIDSVGNKVSSVVIPDTVTDIHSSSFSYAKIKSITIPGSVTFMPGAFNHNETLESIVFEEGIREITNDVCYMCPNLKNVTFPDGLETIGQCAFMACNSLEAIDIPDTVTEIVGNAFSDNPKLSKVKLSAGLKKISRGAFVRCPALTSIDLPDSLEFLGPMSFVDCPIKTITIPAFAEIGTSDFYSVGFYTDGNDYIAGTYDGFTIKGYEGSDAEKYAKAYGIKFISLGKMADRFSLTLSKTEYAYNGKAKKPKATLTKIEIGTVDPSEYTIKYSNNKKVGKATVTATIKYKDNTIVKTANFKIFPKPTKLSKVTAASKGFTATWKKQAKETTEYQIQYSTKSSFKNAKIVKVKKNTTLEKTVKELSAKKKYYVRVRTYKKVGKINYYSTWSKAKTVKTKA